MPFRSNKFSILYTSAILQQSIDRHWKRRALPKVRITLSITLLLTVLSISFKLYWLILSILIIGSLIIGKIYYNYHEIQKRLVQTFADKDTLKIDMTPLSEELCLLSKSGENRIAWDVIKEIWCYPDAWILFTSPNTYITLPLKHLPNEVQDFIQERIQLANGIFK